MFKRIASMFVFAFSLSGTAFAGEICIGGTDEKGDCKGIEIKW